MRYYARSERDGCHTIAVSNPSVIDCEIAFPGYDGSGKRHGTVDLACLEADGDKVRLVFWEAKHYDNDDLRSNLPLNNPPPVCAQVKRYQDYLSLHRGIVVESYVKVCKNLVALKGMGATRKLSPLINSVAEKSKPLILDERPKVGVLIFGFNEAERNDARWKNHLERLKCCISRSPVLAVGDPGQVNL